MMTEKLPLVSIIIPVKPGGYVKALNSVKLLDYPRDRMEVFIAEGCQPSRQRNEAAKEASGEILYFLDDDSCPHSYNLRRLAGHFAKSDVAVAGGPSITPDSDSFIQHCFSDIFTSLFGGGGVRNRYRKAGLARETTEKELILCNLAFRAGLFNEMGGLNERLYPNEENELMARLHHKDYRLIYDPEIFAFRSHRKRLYDFIKQNFRYGRGRMEQTILYPKSFSFMHIIPLLFWFYLFGFSFASGGLYPIPLAFYLFASLFFSLFANWDKKIDFALKLKRIVFVFFLFPALHLSYGAGLIAGIKRLFFGARDDFGAITIKKVSL
jgi:cellulose synthase/poly-beta-1,6-N-acetylglucosamine synthase-like glycosyltransferase